MECCSECKTAYVDVEQVDLSLLDPILDKYKDVKGSVITILQKTQEIYGYLPPSAISHIARVTKVKEAKLFGVATFYTQFRLTPVGKHLIMLCQGTACHVNGADIIEKAIEEELKIKNGETTQDKLFTLFNVACLGCCSLAPVMMIDGETHAKLTPEKTVKILREIREKSAEEGE